MLLALWALFLVSTLVPQPSSWLGILETVWRNSLFVYWIHVELVYRYATWAIHHRPSLWGTDSAFTAFVVLIYRAIFLRDRTIGILRAHLRKSTHGAVPA